MKYFPFILHVILAALFIGLAVGAHEEHMRPMICYPLNGLGAGLGITAVIRLYISAL